jgi:undecaprenyl-diphosphatase
MAGGWHVTQHHERALAFYAPRHTVRSMPLATWQADGWRGLSAWRVDMAGEQEQPLTVQWAGSPDALVRFLMHKGWQRPLSLNLGSLFGMFAPDSPVASLPSLPRLHDGRAERLRLVLVKADERFVLRLWSADATIDGNDGPLLVGTIEAQRRWSLAGLLTMARDTGEYERSLDVLRQALGDGFTTRLVRRSDYEAGVGRMRWGGGVLLVWDNEILSSN